MSDKTAADSLELISALKLHSDLTITINGFLRIRRCDARHDEVGYREIDLKRFQLPINSVDDAPQKLINQPQMLIPALHAISEYSSITSDSKSKANRIAFMFYNIIKFLEYLWLNDIYKLSQTPPSLISGLPKVLAFGGWHSALKISDRLNSFLETIDDPLHPLFNSTNWKVSLSSAGLQLAIGTNIANKETAYYFDQVQQFRETKGWIHSEYTIPPTIFPALNYSSLRQTLESINFLFFVPEDLRLASIPFPDYVRIAKKLTTSPGRTKNIDSHGAGKLMEKSLALIYKRSEAILGLLSNAIKILSDNSDHDKKFKIITNYVKDAELFDLIEHKNQEQRPIKVIDLNNLLRDLITACFLCIAVFNARRRDEILHPKLGLYLGCCTTYNSDLRIYEMMFYIEKSRKDYAPFYVGDATQKAVETLEKLQLIFSKKDHCSHSCGTMTDRHLALFRYKTLTHRGPAEKFTNYNFEAYEGGQAHHFVTHLNLAIDATPHMFRRLYCTIFMNQHEYPHLPALSHQLQHDSLATTQIYITSPVSQNEAAFLSRVYDWKIDDYKTSHQQHNEEISIQMADTTKEKFSEIIYSILSKKSSSGGYSKLILTLYKRLYRVVKFDALDDKDRIESFITKLAARGHSPTPFKHAHCLSENIKIRSPSKCYNKADNQLHKENASPALCKNCPYSWTSPEHVLTLESAHRKKIIALNSFEGDSIIRRALETEIKNLQAVLIYHKDNMEPL
ncbi:hypothetical protein CXQ81_27085 [Pseudomonas sp. 09C 129]|uniref:hypothetical protein n=1 Tax=Pseudomonas sp. 09C 129 TaxID=2054915 RepID=UPI000C6D15ED|nr:hypothetical protein [Pseudomonas sp. 09C 129]AUG04124.1 hypothetical protein CXQ81_27085 [Pseudomonas sp. 09C 129]